MHERDPGIHATLDPWAWLPILARYREPNSARSTIELVITAVPFVISGYSCHTRSAGVATPYWRILLGSGRSSDKYF